MLTPYERPTKSRELHPFVQTNFPEIRRDKFDEGVELDREEFARRALRRTPPLQSAADEASHRLPEDLRAAIDYVFARGDRITSDRNERMKVLENLAYRLEPLRAAIDAVKCEQACEISARFNVAWTAACIDALGTAWPDKELPLKYVIGFEVVFEVADSGVYRPVDEQAEISAADFKAANSRMVASVVDRIKRKAEEADGDPEGRLEQCWKRTKEEIAEGLVRPPKSRAQMDRKYGRGRWRCLARSAIKQKDKWRCIDNGKLTKHNKATRMRERLTTGRADFPVTIAREFAARLSTQSHLARRGIKKRRPLRMQHGTKDLRAAYRHVPTSQPEYTNAAVWNTDDRCVSFVEVPGHNFGLTSAVLNFNRFPELGVTVARRLLWIVTEHFYDDKDTCEPGWCGTSGQDMLDTLFGYSFFGFPFDAGKDVPMRPANEYLGVVSDLSSVDSGKLRIDITAKRRAKLKALVAEVRETSSLTSGLAASIYGKSRFMLSPVYASMGKSALQPIIAREYQKGASSLTPEILEALEFISYTCDKLPPVELPALPITGERVVIFTDAEGKKRRGARPPEGHLGFVVYHPVFGTVHSHAAVPQELVRMMDDIKKRDTYIGQFELIAAITPFLSLPKEWFQGYPIELWIDNSGAIGALIKGYSGVPDAARIVNTFEFAVASLGAASLYIDYVPSKSNPADVPSRAHEMSEAEAAVAMADYGRLVPMRVPAFADATGNWLSFADIASSVWGR